MKRLKQNLLVALISLLLNGIWEYAVCTYFYDNDIVSNMEILMIQATFGDVVITLFFFNLLMFFKNGEKWVFKTYDYFNLSIYGIAAAFYFESKALNIDRWAYLETMPLVGETSIGLLPALQLAVLVPLSIFLTRSYYQKR